MGSTKGVRKLMKAPKSVGIALASLMTLSSAVGVMTGIEPALADDDDDWFEEVRDNCQRVNSGYFCRDEHYSKGNNGRGNNNRVGNGRWFPNDIYKNKDRRNDDYRYGVREGRIYEGTVIPTSTYENDRFEIRRGDSRSLTLVVDRDIRSDTDNYVLIPEGSRIYGKLRSNDGGIRYEADSILINGRSYNLDARSDTIYPRNRSGNRISSSAATVILGTILGRNSSQVGDIFRGGEILSRSRDRREDDYIVINPKSNDLDLRLTEDFRIKK